MNISDSTGPMRRRMAVIVQVFFVTAYNRLKNLSGDLPSLRAFSSWALMVSILLFMVSGCGYREELENAKQQIEKQNSEVRRLTDQVSRLDQEKIRLNDDSKILVEKNTQMQRELEGLNKSKAALAAENKEITTKISAADAEITSLKSEKDRLTKEVEKLEKRVAELAPPSPPPTPIPTEVGPQAAKQQGDPSPCDQVVAFMKASEGVIRRQKGTERTKSLEQVKQQYAGRMKGAPEKAIKAAEDWVKEAAKLWDKSSDDSTFRLLQLRNIVLETCEKSPGQAGF